MASLESVRLKRFVPFIIAVSGGVLMALPWLDERAFVAAWIGLVLAVAVCDQQPPHVAFRRSLLAGIVGLATAFYWFPEVASDNLHVSLLSGTSSAALAITWDAFRFGVFGYLVGWLRQRGVNSVLTLPAVWVALEWGWPHIFPWRMGHSQVGFLPVCQIAEFTGVYGVSFLMVWAAAVAAEFCSAGPVLFMPPREISRSRIRRDALLCDGCGRRQVRASCESRRWNPRPNVKLRIAMMQPGSLGDDHLQRLRNASQSDHRAAGSCRLAGILRR
ncbi:MAG: hypothetical protein R3C19_19235 [Planctomycetaceae bacterium]